VLFWTAVQQLLEDGHDIFLEISAHPILLSSIQQGFHHLGHEGAVLPSLRREEDERTVLLGSLGRFMPWGTRWTGAGAIPAEAGAFDCRFTLGSGSVVGWRSQQRHRLSLAANDSEPDREAPSSRPAFQSAHPGGSHFWEVTLDKRSLPYLDDHRIQGVAVLPASAYLEMALAAAVEVFGDQSFALKDVEFNRALFLPESGSRTIQLILAPGADGSASFHIYSRPAEQAGNSWTLHATGKACPEQDRHAPGSRIRRRSRRSELDARSRSPARTII
jgi:acyl transferase domain-containing protein